MKKIFWGIFFIGAAAFVIINQLGYYTNINIFTLLTTILIIPIFFKSIRYLNFFGILFSIAAVLILYSKPLHLEAITPWPILIAALFGSIGLSVIFSKNHICSINFSGCGNFDKIIDGQDDEFINLDVNFGSAIKYINSENFKGSNLRCHFGAMKVYFDNAKIIEDNAVINLDVSFSGVELFIPKDWKIINNANVSLGDVDERRNHGITTKTVTLKGKVSLSGVEITYI